MLNISNRLNLRFHHNRLRQIGQVKHSLLFTLVYSYTVTNDAPKFSVVVSKKVSKSAVTRNCLKRKITEIIRTNIHQFPNKLEAIIILKKPALTTTSTEVLTDLVKITNTIFLKTQPNS